MELFTEKKWREERQVKIALEGMGFQLDAAVIEPGECPDFVLHWCGKRIGIEHTEFFFSTEDAGAPQGFQNLRHEAVELARCKFRSNGGPALYVIPIFKENPTRMGPKRRRDVSDFAERFESVVQANGWPSVAGKYCHFERLPDIPEIDYYIVGLSIDGIDELWNCGGGGVVQDVEPGQVQAALKTKAGKYKQYAQNCDSVWLLIVNGSAIRTVLCKLGDGARTASYASPFDRVLWLDRFPERPAVELRIKTERGSFDQAQRNPRGVKQIGYLDINSIGQIPLR